MEDLGSTPGLGRFPGGHGNSLQCSSPENPQGQRSLTDCIQSMELQKSPTRLHDSTASPYRRTHTLAEDTKNSGQKQINILLMLNKKLSEGNRVTVTVAKVSEEVTAELEKCIPERQQPST